MPNEHAVHESDELVRKGVRLAARGARADAMGCLGRAIALTPDHAFGRLHLSLALAAEGEFEQGREHLRRALELRPASAAFHLLAGRFFFDAEEYAAASDAFRRAAELSPRNALVLPYRLLSDSAGGRAAVPGQLDPDDLPDSTPFLARLLMLIELALKGRHVEFSDERNGAPFLDRLRIGYLLWRGGLERKRGHFAQAALRAQMVMEMCPGHPGAAALDRECREASLEVARRRVAEEPGVGALRLELAGLLADADRYADAEAEILEARRLFVKEGKEERMKSPEILRLRGRVSYGLGRFDEAAELQRAGAEPGFSMAETHYTLGLCHLAQGARRLCVLEFEPLVAKVCWAVPLRLREYLASRQARSGRASEAGT